MPIFRDPDQAAINADTENGGVTEETKRKRGREKKFFNDLLIAHYGGKPLNEMVKTLDKQALILLLMMLSGVISRLCLSKTGP